MGALRKIFDRACRAAPGEGGFTVIEGVIAAMLLVIGVLGTLQLFDAGTRNTFRAEESQVVNDRLQAELEAIRQLPYSEVGLTNQPTSSIDSGDPRWRVSGTQYALNRNGSSLAQMVFNGGTKPSGGTVSGGVVDPGPTPFKAGDVKGTIHRFVTWTSDPSCTECGAGAMKRVIVAATIDKAAVSSERVFQELHTDIVDPEITPTDNPPPPDEDPGTTIAEFWLTDTTCNNASRVQPTASHLTHNTRGVCSQGLKTGSTRGAPDLMYLEAPPQVEVPEGQPQPTFDYATDSEPAVNPLLDIGLLMPWASNDSCLLSPVLNTLDVKRFLEGLLNVLDIGLVLPGALDGILDITSADADKHKRVHTWVSPPVQGSGGVLLGRGTLDLYTKTINGAVHPGQICVWLSVRQTVTIPFCVAKLLGVCVGQENVTLEVDLPYINVGVLSNGDCRTGTGLNLTNFQHSQNPWPSNWAKISLPLCFAAVNAAGAVIPAVLPPNSRVVLGLMVKRAGTEPGQGLEFMYDAVGFESRLELETNQIIPF